MKSVSVSILNAEMLSRNSFKEKKRNPKHDNIGAQMAAYTILLKAFDSELL